MTNPFDLSIPLTLTQSFKLDADWSVAPEVKTRWTPIVQSGSMFAVPTVTVTLKLAF